jgi:RimJ/RimL family protein N-acetyltransferase
MVIRKTKVADMAACEEIYASAREYMRSSGNPDQWKGSYPGTVEILSDIASGCGYVVEDEGEVVAVFYFTAGPDPTYSVIYDGEWKSNAPYGVIHRVAVKHHGKGIIDFIFNECFEASGHLRIDTHRDNIPMQRVLKRNGFEYCGIIHIESGAERMAFEKTK